MPWERSCPNRLQLLDRTVEVLPNRQQLLDRNVVNVFGSIGHFAKLPGYKKR